MSRTRDCPVSGWLEGHGEVLRGAALLGEDDLHHLRRREEDVLGLLLVAFVGGNASEVPALHEDVDAVRHAVAAIDDGGGEGEVVVGERDHLLGRLGPVDGVEPERQDGEPPPLTHLLPEAGLGVARGHPRLLVRPPLLELGADLRADTAPGDPDPLAALHAEREDPRGRLLRLGLVEGAGQRPAHDLEVARATRHLGRMDVEPVLRFHLLQFAHFRTFLDHALQAFVGQVHPDQTDHYNTHTHVCQDTNHQNHPKFTKKTANFSDFLVIYSQKLDKTSKIVYNGSKKKYYLYFTIWTI